jgi:hypothetical protein
LYESFLVHTEIFSNETELTEEQVRNFMRSVQYQKFLFAVIMRISLEQNKVPDEEAEVCALHQYAYIMAEAILREYYKSAAESA